MAKPLQNRKAVGIPIVLARARLICAGLVATTAGACGSEEESIDGEGCEHLKGGPAVAVTAAAMSAGAPQVFFDHKRYDVTLADSMGMKGGFVSYASTAEKDYVFFFGSDVPVTFKNSEGVSLMITSAKSSTECSEIKGRHHVTLKVGTYNLSLGPTPETKVSIVVEAEEHAH